MRISTGQLQHLMLEGLQQNGATYGRLARQLASGQRILQPSDDPVASVRLQALKREQSALEQYQANIGQARGQLGQGEVQLDGMSTLLLRLRDLTLEAGNGSYGPAERQALVPELQSLRDGLLDLANTRDENGHYLFAGSQVDTPPLVREPAGSYRYQGDTLVRQISVAKGVTLATVEGADQLFFADGDFLADLDGFIEQLASGDEGSGQAANMLERVDGVQSCVSQSLTRIGSRLNRLAQLEQGHADLLLFSRGLGMELGELDYTQAATALSQTQLALQSTQQAFVKVNNLTLFDYL